MDVPCLNHMLNNSFVNTMKSCMEFKNIIESIESRALILRKRDAIDNIGKKCPLPSKTRWLYIYYTLSFMIKNVTRVNSYFVSYWKSTQFIGKDQSEAEFEMQAISKGPMTSVFYEIYCILAPFMQASLCFESEQSRLSDVIPVIQEVFFYYKYILKKKLLREEASHKILKELVVQLLARLRVYLPPETWACWALTRSGRYYLRSVVAASGLPHGDICDYINESFKYNDAVESMRQELEKVLSEPMGDLLSGEKDIEEEDQIDDPQIESLDIQPENSDVEADLASLEDPKGDEELWEAENEENDSNLRFRELLHEYRQKPLTELLEFNIAENGYEKAVRVIRNYHQILNPDVSPNKANELFDIWLYENSRDEDAIFRSVEMEREDDFHVWQNIFKYDSLRTFADIALRLVTVGTSESDVERLISVHRYIVHDKMTNISPDVLLAKLRIHARAQIEEESWKFQNYTRNEGMELETESDY